MRIFDHEKDAAVDNVVLLLSLSEAKELRDALDQIINVNDDGLLVHVSDDTYQREITVARYSDKCITSFHPRIQKLIQTNE